jgi:hypothetical protein
MSLLRKLCECFDRGGARQLKRQASQVAEQIRWVVWQRVCHRALAMQPAEARGYITARAAGAVHLAVDRAIAGGAVSTADRDDLVELVRGEVLRLVTRQWIQARSSPAPTAGRRAAA